VFLPPIATHQVAYLIFTWVARTVFEKSDGYPAVHTTAIQQ